jgi:succinate dehydrogenase / fumarate reductase cytochrome b subunit
VFISSKKQRLFMKASSIFKKLLMAITGLGLIGFLIAHLAGNFLLLGGEKPFNAYAKYLETNPLLIPAEIGLLALFVAHIISAIRVTAENNAARPQAYAVRQNAGQSTVASRTMWYTGALILIFVVVHVAMFKFKVGTDCSERENLFGLVARKFENPAVCGFYVAAMLFLGLHLSHAISSLFQTVGVLNATWRPRAQRVGLIAGWAIAAGFALLPVWAFIAKPSNKISAPEKNKACANSVNCANCPKSASSVVAPETNKTPAASSAHTE